VNALKQFIVINRSITKMFVDHCSRWFGSIDDSENEFYGELKKFSYKSVIEIGGANRPLFRKDDLQEYIGIDIDRSFETNSIYTEYYAQSCEQPLDRKIRADLIVSKYVLEHIPDNKMVFLNIINMLSPGGVSIHIFPLGLHPFSIVNRLVGNRIAKILIPILRPGSEKVTGYPAYYHLCNSASLERFLDNANVKYHVKYFYGAEDYFGFFAPLGCLVHVFNRVMCRVGCRIMASNALLIIKG
jgi:hypothetical protein